MGRHSAPDEDEPDAGTTDAGLVLRLDLGSFTGRHSRGDAGEQPPAAAPDVTPDVTPDVAPDERHTQRIAVVDSRLLDGSDVDTDQLIPLAPAPEAGPQQPEQPAEGTSDKADRAAAKAAAKAAARADKAQQAEAKAAARSAAKAAAVAEKDAAKQRGGPKHESNTRADLRVLRHNSAVRAQALGAVVGTFLVYTLIMLVLGRGPDWVRWVWIPIVVCGVLVGLVLDLAHRRAGSTAAAGQTGEPSQPSQPSVRVDVPSFPPPPQPPEQGQPDQR